MGIEIIMRKIVKMIVTILVLLTLVVGLIGFLLAYIPSKMSEKHTNDIVELYFQDTGYSVDDFNNCWWDTFQEFEIESDLGHTIPVYYLLPNNKYENKTIVLVHWHESNHTAMYPIAQMFLEEGWNVVLYDQRSHGKNTAKTVTFGYLESHDLEEVIDFVKNKSDDEILGVLGQSMGASTIAYYLGKEVAKENLSFAVIDCPYSGMYDEVSWEISQAKIPLPAKVLTSLGSRFCDLIYGYSFSDVDMVEQIKNDSIPTLIMHSKTDKKCPYYMSENLFNAIPHDKKMLITYEDSDHLFSFWDEQERYIEEVLSFINKFAVDERSVPLA